MSALDQDLPIPEGFLAEWCETMAHGTEMPPASYLATGLAVAAAIVGVKLRIRWAPVHRERCNLWLLNVGRSAIARKTTGLSAARWAVNVARQELGENALEWYAPKRLSDAQLAHHLDVVSRDTADVIEAEARQAKIEHREPATILPIVRKVPMAWLLALNEISELWGEGLRDWQAATSSLLLSVFDGELSSDTRATNVPTQETFVCALGNIPPSELAARTTFATVHSGFVGRWLVMPSPGPVDVIATPRPNGTDPLAPMAEHVRRLALLASGRVVEDVAAAMMPAGSEGDVARNRWYAEWRKRVDSVRREDPIESARADLWGRQQAHALKLAAIVAVTRQAHRVDRLADVRIEAYDAVWAQEAVERSIEVVIGAIQEGGGGAATPIGRAEARLLNMVRKAGAHDEETALTVREIAKRSSNTRDGYGATKQAIENLASLGELVVAERRAAGGGRPATVVWCPVADK